MKIKIVNLFNSNIYVAKVKNNLNSNMNSSMTVYVYFKSKTGFF